MDDFAGWFEHLPRAFPCPNPVSGVGYIRRKTSWIKQEFNTMNFSFILSGQGEYRHPKGAYRVTAPCVITQWPGVVLEYGPHECWEELYTVFSAPRVASLRATRLANPDKPVWYFSDVSPIRRGLAELRRCLSDRASFGRADEIDRLCEWMVLESLIGEVRPHASTIEETIDAIRDYAVVHYTEEIDFDALSRDYGLSPSTFRRYWGRQIGMPPARFVMQLRIREACRLLVETDRAVGDVAVQLGFGDPLYFSRKFRKLVGTSASTYRTRHRGALAPTESPQN
jgi:AraC-like DNA-binding protein